MLDDNPLGRAERNFAISTTSQQEPLLIVVHLEQRFVKNESKANFTDSSLFS